MEITKEQADLIGRRLAVMREIVGEGLADGEAMGRWRARILHIEFTLDVLEVPNGFDPDTGVQHVGGFAYRCDPDLTY